jgi:NAD-dependent deacetylase sirtuin 2
MLAGAGISVKSGIPDFRSPGTGLYHNIKKYNLTNPDLLFNRNYIKSNPRPFYSLVKEFISKDYSPSISHYLSVLFNKKNLLMRYYTQNIDSLDLKAGLKNPYLIECHGHMRTATCSNCNKKINIELIKDKIINDKIPECDICKGLIIPDVVMNDDDLPDEFFEQLDKDFHECDLLIVMGTSLKVEPFPGMIEDPPLDVPRVLINNEPVVTYIEELGERNGKLVEISKDRLSQKFKFGHFFNKRDIFLGGDLNENIFLLIKELGWEEDLNKLMNK